MSLLVVGEMDLNNPIFSSPEIKRQLRRIKLFFVCWVVLEAVVFVGFSYWLGIDVAILVTIGFFLVGYFLKPSKGVGFGMDGAGDPRYVSALLMMIPGFVLDVVALLVLIGPVRRRLVGWLQRKLMTIGGGGNVFPFGCCGGPCCREGGARRYAPRGEVIDIEGGAGGGLGAKAEVIRRESRDASAGALGCEEEIIDVRYEEKT